MANNRVLYFLLSSLVVMAIIDVKVTEAIPFSTIIDDCPQIRCMEPTTTLTCCPRKIVCPTCWCRFCRYPIDSIPIYDPVPVEPVPVGPVLA